MIDTYLRCLSIHDDTIKIIKVPAVAPIVNGIKGNMELKHKSNLQNCEIPAVTKNKIKICQSFESAIVVLNCFNSVPTKIKNVANGTDDKDHGN